MSVREHDWMGQVLGVTAPWQVTDVRVQPNTGIVSVQIEQPEAMSRWFGRRNTAGARRLRWDHIGIAGHRCEVVLILRPGQKAPEASWVGEADMPFTRGLSRLVLDLLLEGVGMSQLCRMLELPFSDLWKYKYRIDQGQGATPTDKTDKPAPAAATTPRAPANPTSGGGAAAPAAAHALPALPAPVTATVPPAVQAAEASAPTPAPDKVDVTIGHEAPTQLPPADAPVWLALLKGKLALDVQALSLKLLLTKTLREAQQHTDVDLHRQAAQALHRYFERNQALLGHEIHQIAAAHQAQQTAQKSEVYTLPDASDPLWLTLLLGERELDVRALGLRLLLSRLRGQTRQNQNDEARMLKLVELHRFFEKNQAMLRHEISQLQRWVIH